MLGLIIYNFKLFLFNIYFLIIRIKMFELLNRLFKII